MPDFGDITSRAGELAVRLTVAIAVIAAFAVAARMAMRLAVVLIGCLLSLTLAFPSVRVADVLAIFGIVSVAAGFRVQGHLRNLLAGVLLLLRDPFMSGDQVTIADRDGTVEGVTVREALLRGHDGRRCFIPNATVMTDVIEVETDDTKLRQSFSLLLDPATDLAALRSILQDAIRRAEGVCADPAAEVLMVDIVNGQVELQCRFWSGSRRRKATATRDRAIAAAVAAVVEQDVALSVDELRVELTSRHGGSERRHARPDNQGER